MKGRHPSRRNFLRAAGIGALSVIGRSVPGDQSERPRPRPNFVVILTDDQTYRAIGYTNSSVQTPNLDALANSGIIFDYAYIATPICAASRASMLTGLFPQEHGSVGLDASEFRKRVVDEGSLPTLATLLRAAGYQTGFAGKSHLGDPKAYGFQEGREYKERGDEPTFDAAKRFLETRESGTPFLLWVATHQPHIPLLPEDEWLERYDDINIPIDPNFREKPPSGSLYNQGLPGQQYYRDSEATRNYEDIPAGPPRNREQIRDFTKAYYATITRLDDQVGQLVDCLKSTGQYENTVIVFLSDNGYFLGNHGLGNKITMHEESVRVPMFLHWTGLPVKGVRSESLVSSLDVMPTLLELAGEKAPGHISGTSLAPLFTDPERGLRGYVASECVGVGGKPGEGHRMVRTKRWKYVLTGILEEGLFDEKRDPFELHNLAGDPEYRESLVLMRQYMRDWMDKTGDTHPGWIQQP
ncbi:MAG: sulfatase-like hydrolase/transferase [Candidatus Hydrogenedentota bacterium]